MAQKELQSDPEILKDTQQVLLTNTPGGKEIRLPEQSTGNHDITGVHFRNDTPDLHKKLLLLGGVHGDETEGIALAQKYLEKLSTQGVPEGLDILIIPRFNMDGATAKKRQNNNGVDLNRNMPTEDWTIEVSEKKYYPGTEANSEIETKLMIALIEAYQPDAIVSCHSWKPLLNFNGPSKAMAEFMSKANDYQCVGDIGYPTPGSLGTWAGHERGIPTITFEVERGLSDDINWHVNERAVDNAVEFLLSEDE